MENDTVSTLEDLIDDDGVSQVREYQKVGGGGIAYVLGENMAKKRVQLELAMGS